MGNKIVRRRASIGLLLAVLVAPLIPWQTVLAAPGDSFNLTLSPLPVSLVTKPGETVSTPIQIQNSGTQPARIKVSLMKFAARGNTGQPAILDPLPQDDFIKWASFSQTNFTAQPGVFNTITMTIKPPKSAAFGYYYAVVFSKDDGTTATVTNQNKVSGAVASLVLLDVQTGGEKRQLQVTSFTATKKLYQYLPASFAVNVKNVGNIHAIPSGNIFISRAGSKDFLATLSVNKEQGNILPKSSRVLTTDWNDGFPNYQLKRQNGQIVSGKDGKPQRELNWDLKNINKLRLGHYTASLTMIYNDGKRDVPINGEVSFWVIPWIPALIIGLVLLLLLFAIFMIVRSTLRRLRNLGGKPKKSKKSAKDRDETA